ncbi:MAG: hypothetical protein WC934_02810 [Acidithiobacillus sp.]|jgi:hypothetical protein|uniref:hypothetical protein n=1 Tax=Acidithiobacillus sp. TaxID=1872118 RepID=UPI00355DC367
MALVQTKFTVYFIFIMSTLVVFVILYVFGMMFRDFIFGEIFVNSQITLVQLIDLLTVYLIIYVIWNILLIIFLFGILNMIMAKILNIQLGKILGITVISLITVFILYHVCMYGWFVGWFGFIGLDDPIGVSGLGILKYLELVLKTYTDGEFTLDLNSEYIFNMIFDLYFGYYYEYVFAQDPSFINYLLLYIFCKSVVSDVPFQVGSGSVDSINPFQYETLVISIMYFILFSLLYWKYADTCECYTNEMIQLTRKEKSTTIFGESESEGIGEFIVEKRVSKTLQ